VSMSEREQVARKSEWIPRTPASSNTLRGLSWYEMTLMDAHRCEETPRSIVLWNMSLAQDPVQVVGKLFGSEGAATAADGVETDPGGGSKSTFVAKREC
jgi:hypothetical protein